MALLNGFRSLAANVFPLISVVPELHPCPAVVVSALHAMFSFLDRDVPVLWNAALLFYRSKILSRDDIK